METKSNPEWLALDTRLVTRAGLVAVFGALLIGIASVMGANAFLNAVRHWVNQQSESPTETAKGVIRQLHDAALASTSAATDAWASSIAAPKDH